MVQQVQELIDKIKAEGVDEAQNAATTIKGDAQNKAAGIVANAQEQADQLIAEAKNEAQKIQDSTRMALQQASRDMLLSLRKEIEHILQKIVSSNIQGALTPDHLSKVIKTTIEKYLESNDAEVDIHVVLSSADYEKLKNGIISQISKEVKNSITLKSNKGISKGFTISFDSGKSVFDFTDESIADYLCTYLNEEVASLLKASAKK